MTDYDDVHDRTRRLSNQLGLKMDMLGQLSSRRVVIEIGDAASGNSVACLGFLTACNLATRLGPYLPNLYVRVPHEARGVDSPIFPSGASLREQALWVVRNAIDMDGLVRDLAGDLAVFDIALTIGESGCTADERIHFGGQGWLGFIGESNPLLPIVGETNHFGALLAAAMGVARLHALQANQAGASVPRLRETWTLNALTLKDGPDGEPLPSRVALPKTLLIGGGALASAIAYAMTHLPGLDAVVDAVDDDILKRPNANRQITAPFAQAESESVHKVDELATAWAAIRPEPRTYNDFKKVRGSSAGTYELAVTAVDNAEARREVALDLPKVLIDGATGSLTVALMRGSDPSRSCIACAYPELKTDEDTAWAQRLGHSREDVQKLRNGSKRFDADVIQQILEHGTLVLDEERKCGLLNGGWWYLSRAGCGSAALDRDLPAASVSYVSAICGFLMAAQMVGEAIGCPTLASKPRWVWDDVLRQRPSSAQFEAGPLVRLCAQRHDLRSNIYRNRWQKR